MGSDSIFSHFFSSDSSTAGKLLSHSPPNPRKFGKVFVISILFMNKSNGNIFVLGLDAFNERVLKNVEQAKDYDFYRLLDFSQLKGEGGYPFEEVLEQADAEIRRYGQDRVAAIVGYWDFPISSMVPILTERFGLPGPSTTAVVKCENKYWSRLQQKQVVPEACPSFALLDPFVDVDRTLDELPVDFPFFLKPIKGTSSMYAYKIENHRELKKALKEIREGVEKIANAFDELLERVHLPDHVADATGNQCLVEGLMHGRQCSVCGYSFGYDVHIYGLVDSLTYPDSSVFERLQYPSQLPEDAQEKMCDISRRVIDYIGLNDAGFNVEFFWDPADNKPRILEINPRISQSHGMVFGYVDGRPDHQIMIDLALGREPDFPKGEGDYQIAAKWYWRRFEDAFVDRIPSEEEIREIEADTPACLIKNVAQAGRNLHDLAEQDPSAYDLAYIWMGAQDEEELRKKYEQVKDRLRFEFSDPR